MPLQYFLASLCHEKKKKKRGGIGAGVGLAKARRELGKRPTAIKIVDCLRPHLKAAAHCIMDTV